MVQTPAQWQKDQLYDKEVLGEGLLLSSTLSRQTVYGINLSRTSSITIKTTALIRQIICTGGEGAGAWQYPGDTGSTDLRLFLTETDGRAQDA